VNFVMKKDFEGLSLDVQTGATAVGDAAESRLSALFGANVGDGRGNVMMGVEYADREEAKRYDRPFFDAQLRDPSAPATNTTFLTPTQYTPAAANLPDINVVRSIFQAGSPVGTLPANANAAVHVRESNDQTLWTNAASGTGAAAVAWGSYRYADGFPAMQGWGPDQPLRKVIDHGGQPNGVILENQPFSLISTPLTRHSIFGRGRYEVADGLEVYAQGNFVTNTTRTIMTWSAGFGRVECEHPARRRYLRAIAVHGGQRQSRLPRRRLHSGRPLGGRDQGCELPVMGGCTNDQAFPVPPELKLLLDSRRLDPDGTTGPLPVGPVGSGRNETWSLGRVQDYLEVPRSTDNDSKLFQLMLGTQGEVSAIDGTWGRVRFGRPNRNQEHHERLRRLAAVPKHRLGLRQLLAGARCSWGPGTTTPFQGNGGTASCQSGIPIFGNFRLSPDCLEALAVGATNTMYIEQNMVEATVQGRIGEIYAGEVRFAGGASYRENAIDYEEGFLNNKVSSISNLIGQPSGANTAGETSAADVFGEVSLPLIQRGRCRPSVLPGARWAFTRITTSRARRTPIRRSSTSSLARRCGCAAAGSARTARRTSASCTRRRTRSYKTRLTTAIRAARIRSRRGERITTRRVPTTTPTQRVR
jgi:hypothetical protein